MAKNPKGAKPEDQTLEPAPNPLASQFGRAWLTRLLAESEAELLQGPNKSGWQYNEALRPAVEAKTAFLRALVALLPAE